MAKKFKTISLRTEYFEGCIDSYLNGQISQCREFFKVLSRNDKKALILHIMNPNPKEMMFEKDKMNMFQLFFGML